MLSDRYKPPHREKLHLVQFCIAKGSWTMSDAGRFMVLIDEEVRGCAGDAPFPIGLEASPVVASTDFEDYDEERGMN